MTSAHLRVCSRRFAAPPSLLQTFWGCKSGGPAGRELRRGHVAVGGWLTSFAYPFTTAYDCVHDQKELQPPPAWLKNQQKKCFILCCLTFD
ncbi:hypothetical protein BDZ85DRAFT_260649 [Elsinoe ampelina]|uniref:Uncharacterized protein n=1 Tax=Elsinoe ampelina TaxID=302913 RepID=A0A6A6GFP5_9PEZI|nr:hypothetical protein BDZ85DRAFT_260649 [Elsinoe ampelina]